MSGAKTKRDADREAVRAKRDAARAAAAKKREAVRAKVRGAAGAVVICVAISLLAACNTATPASKSASSKACDNVTTINNYIGVLPTNVAGYAAAPLALASGGLTIEVHDVNGTISQSADTSGGDSTDLTANPSMAAGITGDKPIEAIQKAVSAFASPQDALSATLEALVAKYGMASATNALVTAASGCTGDGCNKTQ